MTIFGIVEIILSQIPSFDHISWLSNVAVVLSFTYPTIGLELGIAKVAGLRSSSETKTMKMATLISEGAITFFYMLYGCIGYAAFGDSAPKNLLTGFGYYNPYWLLDIANVAMFIHQIIAYQLYCQSLFAFIEKSAAHWPYNLKLILRFVWRTMFVIITTVISMLVPYDDVAGLLGTFGFWPLTVYFPVEMYIEKKKIQKGSANWWCLKILSGACLITTIAVAIGSVAGVIYDLKGHKLFGGFN